MTSALLLTVAAALCWSAFDACRKALVDQVRPVPVAAALAWAQAPVFALWAAADGAPRLTEGYVTPGLAVCVLNTGASLAFFTALRLGDLSRTVPLLSLSPVFSALLGVWVLDEALVAHQWLGVALVVGGAVALAWPRADLGDAADPRAAGRRLQSAAWMTATAALWAGTSVYDKVSLQHASMAVHAGLQTLVLALLLSGWLALRGRWSETQGVLQQPRAFVLGVVVSTLALGLQLTAVQTLPVGVMESVKRATGMVGAVVVGRVLFAEPLTVAKWAAVAAMAAGVSLVVSAV